MSLLRPIQPGPSGSTYFQLKKRMIQNVQAARANDQVFEAVQKLFEKSLNEENIVLSRPEKNRLLREVLKSVLTDMLTKLDKDK
jgi:hypothetical protein